MNTSQFINGNPNLANAMMMSEYERLTRLERIEVEKHNLLIKKAFDQNKAGKSQTQKDKEELARQEELKKKREEELKKKQIRRPEIRTLVPKSEYFYSRDRLFLEERIMKKLKTEGIAGRDVVSSIDKKMFFKDQPGFTAQNLTEYDNEKEYFENYIKDGIYLDYIKKLIFSYNIQKLEQRSM